MKLWIIRSGNRRQRFIEPEDTGKGEYRCISIHHTMLWLCVFVYVHVSCKKNENKKYVLPIEIILLKDGFTKSCPAFY